MGLHVLTLDNHQHACESTAAQQSQPLIPIPLSASYLIEQEDEHKRKPAGAKPRKIKANDILVAISIEFPYMTATLTEELEGKYRLSMIGPILTNASAYRKRHKHKKAAGSSSRSNGIVNLENRCGPGSR